MIHYVTTVLIWLLVNYVNQIKIEFWSILNVFVSKVISKIVKAYVKVNFMIILRVSYAMLILFRSSHQLHRMLNSYESNLRNLCLCPTLLLWYFFFGMLGLLSIMSELWPKDGQLHIMWFNIISIIDDQIM